MSKILITGFKCNLNTMQVIMTKINLNVDKLSKDLSQFIEAL